MLLHRLVRRGGAKLFGKKFLILIVVTDPIPEERVVFEPTRTRSHSLSMTSPSGFVLPSAISRRTRSRTRCIRPPGWESRAISSSHASTWPSSKSASQARSSSRSLRGSDFTCSAICSTRVVILPLSHGRLCGGNPRHHRGIAAVRRTTELISGGPSALLYRWTLSAV